MQWHFSVHKPIQKKRSANILFSCVLAVSISQQAFALTANASLPGKSQLTLKKAQQHILENHYQQAFDLSSVVLKGNPDQYEARFIQALSLTHLGKSSESIRAYKNILKKHPNKPEIYNNLANLYAKQGKLDLARETLEQGIATNEQYKTLYENLSAVYVEIARGAYSKALKLGVQAKTVQLKTLKIASISNPIPIAEVSGTIQASVNKVTTKPTTNTPTETTIALLDNKQSTKKVIKPAVSKVVAVKTIAVKAVSVKNTIKTKVVLKTRPKQTPKINKDEVITALHGWAAAWSAQAVDLYLSFYGKDFKPSKLSKKVWAVQRRIRIKKPRWVNVRLADFNVKSNATKDGHAVVQVVQNYRADNYRDKTKKQFVMKHTMDGWRILSEQSLAVLK